MANLKISQLTELSESDGTEYTEVIISPFTPGTNRKILTSKIGISRELERAYSDSLIFDKNEIEGLLHVQTDEITFTVPEGGHLNGQWSVYGQRVTTDGVNPIYFNGFNHISNISNGEILEAGTYQFVFWYSNGIARATVMLPSEEEATLTPLTTPANFTAVAGGDPDTEIDLSWTAVANAVSLELQFSTTGDSGPWSTVIPLAGGATTYSHTALTPSTQYHYRLRGIGDGITFNNSNYATTVLTTENAADPDGPQATFNPDDAETEIPVNQSIIITFDEAARNTDGSAITNANVGALLTVKEDNSGGANIAFDNETINAGKTIITIPPTIMWGANQDVYVAVNNIEDVNGNEETVAQSVIFTTNDYTIINQNSLSLGSQIDAIITGDDIDFEIEAEFKNLAIITANKTVWAKYESVGNERAFVMYTYGNSVYFAYYYDTGGINYSVREIRWPDALLGFTEGKITLKYFGAIDTNNGLDRGKLFIDDVEFTTGKTLHRAEGPHTWPFPIAASTAPFVVALPALEQIRNLIVRNNSGATTIVNIPIIRTGTDNSGNSFDGTWS